MIKFSFPAFFITALIASGFNCQSSTQQPITNGSVESKTDDWQQLFDGESIKGWHAYGKANSGASWKAEKGILFIDTIKNGKRVRADLVTDDEYVNYHLALDWKVDKGSNSGIIFNVQDDATKYPDTYLTGPEMQVIDNERHEDAKIAKHRAGDLYDLIASSKETVHPAGEWNHAEIVLNKGKLDFYLNDTHTVSTILWTNEWNQLVANGKFKSMPAFGSFKKGHIALQDHGDPVYFKNIKIKKL